jgi:hypothetical protein
MYIINNELEIKLAKRTEKRNKKHLHTMLQIMNLRLFYPLRHGNENDEKPWWIAN